MRVLYGVVGEGMGHATRSRVVIEHLLGQGHEVHVVVSGKAHDFLRTILEPHPKAAVTEIAGLRLVENHGAVDKSASLWHNLAAVPESLRKNLGAYLEVAGAFRPEVVVSDFDSWAYGWARAHDVPVISVDNIQMLHRCAHDRVITGSPTFASWLGKASTKVKLPGAWHYLITSFYYPPVRKRRTTLVPPILRPEILAAQRTAGDRRGGPHVLVYQHASAVEALLPALRARTEIPFRVYGAKREGTEGNLTFRPFSQTGFVDDLASARGAVAGGGFSLMSECVHLGVPLLSIPLAEQAEQHLNARWLQALGYGRSAPALDPEVLGGFLDALDEMALALESYPRQDNAMALGCVDELLERIRLGEPRPDALHHANMGDSVDAAIADAIG